MTNPSIHPVIREDLSEIHSSQLDWDRFRSKTVLVTGGGGCLPSSMIEALLWMNSKCGLDCRIICLVRNLGKAKLRFSAYSRHPGLCFVVGDVADGVPIDSRCDFVIHAASQASPRFYGSDPVGTMAANLLGTHHLLKLAREWSSESFLFFSSGEVYGEVDPEKIPICESSYGYIDILNPRSCYAESKRAAETLAVSFVHQYGVPCVIVRPFHTYGPGMSLDDGRVYADFVNDIVHNRNIILRSDGSSVRAFCYLSDAVRAFFTILLNGTPGVAYNSGNPSAKSSVSDLADTLVALFPERNLTVERVGTPAAGYLTSPVASSVPDVSALAALGWQPRYQIAEGFSRTVRYYMDQR